MKIKAFKSIQFFTVDRIHTCDDLNGYHFNYLVIYSSFIQSQCSKD